MKEDFNIDELNNIPIPEGLEQRLLDKIDQWEMEETLNAEKQGESKHREIPFVLTNKRIISIAASFLLLLGLGWYSFSRQNMVPTPKDTYSDPMLAQKEAERAFQLLANNLNKGYSQLEAVNEMNKRIEQNINDKLAKFN